MYSILLPPWSVPFCITHIHICKVCYVVWALLLLMVSKQHLVTANVSLLQVKYLVWRVLAKISRYCGSVADLVCDVVQWSLAEFCCTSVRLLECCLLCSLELIEMITATPAFLDGMTHDTLPLPHENIENIWNHSLSFEARHPRVCFDLEGSRRLAKSLLGLSLALMTWFFLCPSCTFAVPWKHHHLI